MSKEDFRDRLKSYSKEPDRSEWIKMQQLLDADQDDEKTPFLWWKTGALFVFILGLITLFGIFMKNEQLANSNAQNFQVLENQKNKSELKEDKIILNKELNENSKLSDDEQSVVSSTLVIEKPTPKTSKSNVINTNKVNQKLPNSASPTQNEISISLADQYSSQTSSSISKNTSSFENTNSRNTSLDIQTPSSPNNIAIIQDLKEGYDNFGIALLGLKSLNVKTREKPRLQKPLFTEVQNEVKRNPWYIANAIGMKYPIVNIGQASINSLIPTQKFFPSFMGELGIGKNLGRLALELGVNVSLYQFKLAKEIDANDPFVLQVFEDSESNQTNRDEIVGENFTVSKFATISPYVRTQYNIPLKRNFNLGLHTGLSLNRYYDLPDQFVREDATFGNEPFNQVLNSPERNQFNLNADFGFSIEKLLHKKGKIAIDLAYTFATGILEEGDYSFFKGTIVETQGAYTINGSGPKVKFRYYLNLGK